MRHIYPTSDPSLPEGSEIPFPVRPNNHADNTKPSPFANDFWSISESRKGQQSGAPVLRLPTFRAAPTTARATEPVLPQRRPRNFDAFLAPEPAKNIPATRHSFCSYERPSWPACYWIPAVIAFLSTNPVPPSPTLPSLFKPGLPGLSTPGRAAQSSATTHELFSNPHSAS